MFCFIKSLFKNVKNRCSRLRPCLFWMWWRYIYIQIIAIFFFLSIISSGYEIECDIEKLASYCNSNSHCQGFNTNGLLKSCTSGCDVGCCYDVTQNVDLYIRKGFLPPNDWQDDVNSGRILYANPEPHYCFLPEIANGYVGTVAMSASLFQSGLFNGKVNRD